MSICIYQSRFSKYGKLKAVALISGVMAMTFVIPPLSPSYALQAQSTPDSSEQIPVALVADQILLTPERTLIAQGNVEAFRGRTKLQAERISFDSETGSLEIIGPIRIDEGGDVTILADAAQLDRDLQNGLLRGAKLIFQQQVQLSALQMTRAQGRYTQLYKTAVTSCDICNDGRPPLWQIRAERVTHDQQERQLFFENAHILVRDVPIFYLPALRIPDPTLERATGFLVPSLLSTSDLGTGIQLPYFIKIGDHKDLTVTPHLSTETRSIALKYRQAFHNGDIEINTAFSRDEILPGEDRGYLFAKGTFTTKRGYTLKFDIQTVSDDTYLADFDISDTDRLSSTLGLSKANRDKLVRTSFTTYKTLRSSEDQDTVPTNVVAGTYEKRLFPRHLGGEFQFGLDLLSFNRASSVAGTETESNGRDVTRVSADASWQRNWSLPYGVQANWITALGVDSVALSDDDFFENDAIQVTPATAVTFRLPLARTTASGAKQIIEPIAQLGWSNISGDDIPNETSNISEFDQGNLLSLSRFPEDDARDDGTRFVYGLNWSHFDPKGWETSASVGQIFRSDALSDFTQSSGLDGISSNLLLASQLRTQDDLTLTARGLLDTDLSITKAEFRGDWENDKLDLSGSYIWLEADEDEDRDDDTSELWLDGSYRINSSWKSLANVRYDIDGNRATRAGVGVSYSNECVTLSLSFRRSYTSTTSVEPQTDLGFTLSLNGFSVKSGNTSQRRSCSTT